MKLLIILSLAVLVTAKSAPTFDNPGGEASLLKYENDNTGFGSFRYAYEQSDGTRQEQEGFLENEGTKEEYLSVKGSFTWVGPDGVTYTVHYVANKEGYQPEIDQGPGGAVPPAVLASLAG
uniref:Cuticle protein 2 n=1 Tax=Lonomia obliqua TaxID=304329 RepID=Q5MGQ3_LONON|nr:cuticle protein 2 [Lonomia obliqua]